MKKVAEQVRKWRENQKQKAGGMTLLSVWVTKKDRDFLREIFDRLADPERGEPYRWAVFRWLRRRRLVKSSFGGMSYDFELDGPAVGHSGYYWPMGGRIIGPCETWIELSPEEAAEAHSVCRRAVDAALEAHLRQKGWGGKLIDRTGVATDVVFADTKYPAHRDDILARPATEETFRENEERIQRHILRLADAKVAKWETPLGSESLKHVFEFESLNGIMSRCHLFHGHHNGQPFIAFGHIPGSLASPTNHIERLAELVWREKGSQINPSEIIWFDCMSDYTGTQPRIAQVEFEEAGRKGFSEPRWFTADQKNIPKVLLDEMLPLLRKSTRHPDLTTPEVRESLAIFWQMQSRRGILQFCSSECPMDDMKNALENGNESRLHDFLRGKTNPRNTHYVEAYGYGIWPKVYAAMRDIGLPMITLEQANWYDGRELEVEAQPTAALRKV